MKPKRLINYAHLNDQKGDLSKCWFVEYSFRLPDDDKMFRRRIYDGLGTGTKEQRIEIAERYIATINDYLKSGEYLNHDANYSPVGQTDGYRPEQKRYEQRAKDLTARVQSLNFIEYKSSSLRGKSLQDYRSKIKDFYEFVEQQLGDMPVTKITRKDVCAFLQYLSTPPRSLCRRTIRKHEQVVHCLFDYLEQIELIPAQSNPVYKIPAFGKVLDCSPEIYTADERERLKNAISNKEPFLWLACQMIYYCAIRPGTELRLLKIKHINQSTRIITIPAELAKNKCTESVAIPSALYEEMERMHIFRFDPELYLFGRYGVPSSEPQGKNTMRNRFNLYREACGISTDHKFYSWKHSGSVEAIQNGASPLDLRDHLRHKRLDTTEHYIKKYKPRGDTPEYITTI